MCTGGALFTARDYTPLVTFVLNFVPRIASGAIPIE